MCVVQRVIPLTIIGLTVVLYQINLSDCFTSMPESKILSYHRRNDSSKNPTASSLHVMSGQGSKKTSFRDRLPPKPEDFIVLGGDIAVLYTYSFLDHVITSIAISETKASVTAPDSLLIPVWSDVASHNFGQSFLSAVLTERQIAQIGDTAAAAAAIDFQNIHRAPCLDSFGISTVLLVSCWLVSGYFNRAFSYQNTISCDPRHALLVASKTWIFSAAMMVGVAYWSSNCFCPNTVAGLTPTDTEFIFDTFTVLVMWRFMAAVTLGNFMR